MLFTTLPQLIVLVVLFLGGVFIGLGLHPGGKKWKQRFNDESANYAKYRRDAEERLRDANQRIATLEREHAALSATAATRTASAAATPLVAEPAPMSGIAVPIAASAAIPAFATGSGTEDLSRIRGIDGKMNRELTELGVTRYEDIVDFTAEDEMALEQRLSLPAGYITREQWRDQAALLKAGQDKDHAERFGAQGDPA